MSEFNPKHDDQLLKSIITMRLKSEREDHPEIHKKLKKQDRKEEKEKDRKGKDRKRERSRSRSRKRKHICLMRDPQNNREYSRGSTCNNDYLDTKSDHEMTRFKSAYQAVHKKPYDPK